MSQRLQQAALAAGAIALGFGIRHQLRRRRACSFDGRTVLISGGSRGLGLLMAMVFVAGTVMNTAQSSLPALAAGFYPTQGRATGVAWMLGLGRFGGIAGSFLVAELARRELGFGGIFMVVAVPGLVAAAALVLKQVAHPEHKAPSRGGVAGRGTGALNVQE